MERQAERLSLQPAERMEEPVPHPVKGATQVGASRVWEWQSVCGSAGMIRVVKVFSHLGVCEPRLPEGGIGAFAVRSDVQRLAWRVMQIGGKFGFPVGHNGDSFFISKQQS